MAADQQQVFNYLQQTMDSTAILSAGHETTAIISPATSPISLQQKTAKSRNSVRPGNRNLQAAKGPVKAPRSASAKMLQAKSTLKLTTPPKTPVSAAVVPKLLEAIQYHPNKVRQFASKKRTPQEQLRRERNTRACLLSRLKKRAENLMVTHCYEEQAQEQQQCFVEMQRMEVYLYCLHQLMAMQPMAATSDTPIDLSMGRRN